MDPWNLRYVASVRSGLVLPLSKPSGCLQRQMTEVPIKSLKLKKVSRKCPPYWNLNSDNCKIQNKMSLYVIKADKTPSLLLSHLYQLRFRQLVNRQCQPLKIQTIVIAAALVGLSWKI